MKKLFSIPEEATLSFSKDIEFLSSPKRFEVTYYGNPPISWADSNQNAEDQYNKGCSESDIKFSKELADLREELACRQQDLLAKIQNEASSTLTELENRLPELLIGLFEHILPGLKIDAQAVEGIVVSLIKEFADENESLDVFLCPDDLKLLKALNNPESNNHSTVDPENEDGFASAISGIFDNLDGDDSLLPDYPNVRFHEDASLGKGDCQIKSRFGLLDGRIATKLRRIESSMTQNG